MRRTLILGVALVALGFLPRAASALTNPVIQEPRNGSLLRAVYPDRVRIAGTYAPGATVDVVETNPARGVIATTSPDDGGAWAVYVPMPGGRHTIYAVPRDGSGAPSPSVTFDVDSMRPNTPRIDHPANGTVFKPGETPRLDGRASDEHGVLAVQVEYYLLNQMVLRENMPCSGCGSTSVTWNHRPALAYPGYYVAKVVAYDLAGSRSDVSQVTFFSSGTGRLPVQPPDLLPKPPVIETPQPGSILAGAGSPGGPTVTIGGLVAPGMTVDVFATPDPDGWMGSTVGDSRTGRWSLKAKLEGGTYAIQAQAADAAGRTSALSARVLFSVDTVRPAVSVDAQSDPIVFLPTQPVVLSGTTSDDRHVIAVQLEYWLGDKLVLVENASCPDCATRAGARWTDSPSLSSPGYYYVNVRAIDVAGNRSLTDSIRFIKTV